MSALPDSLSGITGEGGCVWISSAEMGNELASCACGQKEKKPGSDEKKPLVKPDSEKKPTSKKEIKDEKKPKKSKKLLSKKQKKKSASHTGETTPGTPSNPDVKDIIRVDVEREITSPVTTPSSVSPKIARFPEDPVSDTFEFLSARRTLYPPPGETGAADRSPAKPRRNLTGTKHTEFGREPLTKTSRRPPVFKLSDDDIEITFPPVTVHDSLDNIPVKTRQRLKESEEAKISDDAKSQVHNALSRQKSWIMLDRTIREQYDIIYVAPDKSKPPFKHLEEIVVIIQREVQKIYVIVNPNMINLNYRKLAVIAYLRYHSILIFIIIPI